MNPSAWRIVLDIGTTVLVAAGGCALAWRCLRKSADPARLVFKWIFSAGLIFAITRILPHFPEWTWPLIAVPFGIALGVTWASSAGALMAGLLTNSMDGGDVPLEAQPFYSVAETKRRNGQAQEAVALVREQLEQFPEDFRGVMLLASILAEDLHDLPGAQLTLEGWMEGPAATPQGIASALTALADWHLQFARNPEGARAALQRIVHELPDSPAAHQAAQRLAHLPTAEYMAEGRTAAPVGLRPAEKDIGLRKEAAAPAESSQDPDALAEEYVKQLEKHPSDTATREKLALLYAAHFHRLDLAVDQVEQLIALPHETPRHIAEWLNLLADLHIRFGNDLAGAEAALRRILAQFSTPSLVEPTIARLASLEGELKGGQATQVKALGQYEKNLGLKKTTG
jgi:tetratricopeptide (TPR) repeat protein